MGPTTAECKECPKDTYMPPSEGDHRNTECFDHTFCEEGTYLLHDAKEKIVNLGSRPAAFAARGRFLHVSTRQTGLLEVEAFGADPVGTKLVPVSVQVSPAPTLLKASNCNDGNDASGSSPCVAASSEVSHVVVDFGKAVTISKIRVVHTSSPDSGRETQVRITSIFPQAASLAPVLNDTRAAVETDDGTVWSSTANDTAANHQGNSTQWNTAIEYVVNSDSVCNESSSMWFIKSRGNCEKAARSLGIRTAVIMASTPSARAYDDPYGCYINTFESNDKVAMPRLYFNAHGTKSPDSILAKDIISLCFVPAAYEGAPDASQMQIRGATAEDIKVVAVKDLLECEENGAIEEHSYVVETLDKCDSDYVAPESTTASTAMTSTVSSTTTTATSVTATTTTATSRSDADDNWAPHRVYLIYPDIRGSSACFDGVAEFNRTSEPGDTAIFQTVQMCADLCDAATNCVAFERKVDGSECLGIASWVPAENGSCEKNEDFQIFAKVERAVKCDTPPTTTISPTTITTTANTTNSANFTTDDDDGSGSGSSTTDLGDFKTYVINAYGKLSIDYFHRIDSPWCSLEESPT
eukprot:gene14474-21866_t